MYSHYLSCTDTIFHLHNILIMYADNLSCTQYLHHVQTTEQKLTVTEGVITSVIYLLKHKRLAFLTHKRRFISYQHF